MAVINSISSRVYGDRMAKILTATDTRLQLYVVCRCGGNCGSCRLFIRYLVFSRVNDGKDGNSSEMDVGIGV